MSTVTHDQLISPEYQAQLDKMRDPQHMPRLGAGGQRHVPHVLAVISAHKVKSIVDYGCGHGKLMEEIAKTFPPHKLTLTGYDPGMPQFSALPEPADMVISTDVLEHVEPEKLDGVLTHIRFLTGKVAYLHIHTGPANAILPDGRNAHLIQKPAEWWQEKLAQYYTTVEPLRGSNGARKGSHIFGGYRPTFLCV